MVLTWTGCGNTVGGYTWHPFDVCVTLWADDWTGGWHGRLRGGGRKVGGEGREAELKGVGTGLGDGDNTLHGDWWRYTGCARFDGDKGSVRLVRTDNFSVVDSINWFIPWIWAAKDEKASRVGPSWNAFLRTDTWPFLASSCSRKVGHCFKNNPASGWDKMLSRLMIPESGKCSCIELMA
jgi:hypothetical protein